MEDTGLNSMIPHRLARQLHRGTGSSIALKDDYTKSYWVINRNPQKGEPPRWETVRDDPQRRVFGLIAYVQNLAGDSNALILEGTSMSGTGCVVLLGDPHRLMA